MSERRIYTDEQVVEIAERVVAEFGLDYVYPKRADQNATRSNGCDYVRDGQPSCLAGRIVHRMGMPLDMLAMFEGHGVQTVVGQARLLGVVDPYPNMERPISISNRAARALGMAQSMQDSGSTWGEALNDLKERISR